MAEKIVVYNIGEQGVNVVKSPLHLDDGELVRGQNALFDTEGEAGALRKRYGLTKLNSVALDGAVQSVFNNGLPFGADLATTLWAALEASAGSNTWRRSTDDGATWGFVTAPEKTQQIAGNIDAQLTQFQHATTRCVSYKQKLYYASTGYVQHPTANSTQPEVRVWDGTIDEFLVTIPPNTSVGDTTNAMLVLDMVVGNGKIYLGTFDGEPSSVTKSRVFEIDPSTGVMRQIGPEFSGAQYAYCLAWFNNKLWMGTSNDTGSTGKIYSIRPDFDTAWVTEYTATIGFIQSLAVYDGQLYAGLSNAAATTTHTPLVVVRGADGTWATSDTAPAGTSTAVSWYDSLIVYQDELYAFNVDADSGGNTLIVRKFDGSSWSTDKDISASFTSTDFMGQALVHDGKLFVALPEVGGDGTPGSPPGMVLQNNAGTWSSVDSLSARGFLGVTKV